MTVAPPSFIEVGGFPEAAGRTIFEDYALWLRLAQRSPIAALDAPLVDYRDDWLLVPRGDGPRAALHHQLASATSGWRRTQRPTLRTDTRGGPRHGAAPQPARGGAGHPPPRPGPSSRVGCAMSRKWSRLGFGDVEGVGRLGSLSATLGAGSTVQVLGALAGFVTLPIQINALGSPAFGVLVVVVSLAPWLTLIDGALYPSTRLLVGEARRGDQFTAPQAILRSAFRLALKIASMNLATLLVGLVVLPLVAIFGSRGITDRGDLVVAILAFSLPIIASGPGGVYLGALEGVGRTVVAAILAGAGPLTALPLTIIAVALGGDLVTLCAIQGSGRCPSAAVRLGLLAPQAQRRRAPGASTPGASGCRSSRRWFCSLQPA